MIDSKPVADKSIEEYKDRLVTRWFSRKEWVNLVEVFALVARGFEVHKQETHACMLMKAPYGLMNTPQAWYFRINELLPTLGFSKICVDFYIWFLDKSDPFVLVLYIDEFILTWSFEQLKMWCEKKLTHESDIGVW